MNHLKQLEEWANRQPLNTFEIAYIDEWYVGQMRGPKFTKVQLKTRSFEKTTHELAKKIPVIPQRKNELKRA